MTELETQIVELYTGGLSYLEIAKRLHINNKRITSTLKAQNILIYRSRRKFTINEHVFDVIDNELAAYWYGFIYADGCVRKTFLEVVLAEKDKDHLAKLPVFLETNKPMALEHFASSRDLPRARVTAFSEHMTDRLRELGIVPHRPTPQSILENVPPTMLHHWLRGFFDGDGCVDDQRKAIWFCGSPALLEITRDILAQQASRNPDHTIWKHTTADLWYLRYKGYTASRAIAAYMYQDATIWLPRKRDIIDAWPIPRTRSEWVKAGWITRKANATPHMTTQLELPVTVREPDSVPSTSRAERNTTIDMVT